MQSFERNPKFSQSASIFSAPEDFAFTKWLSEASKIRIAVAFGHTSGWKKVESAIKNSKAEKIEILLGQAFFQTEPELLHALRNLHSSQPRIESRLASAAKTFHPKVWLVTGRKNTEAVIGSSNLSNSGLSENVEANLFTSNQKVATDLIGWFDAQWLAGFPLDGDVFDEYVNQYEKLREARKNFQAKVRTARGKLKAVEERRNWEYRVMEKIQSPVPRRPEHGYYIELSRSGGCIGSAYFSLEYGKAGARRAQVVLYPADVIEQAKPFYSQVDISKILSLKAKKWDVQTNLHFGGPYGRGWPPRINRVPVGLSRYIRFWKEHPERIKPIARETFSSEIRGLQKLGLMPKEDYKSDLDRLRKFKTVRMLPGLQLTFKWPSFQGDLPSSGDFAPKLQEKINEAMQTWGEVYTYPV